MECSPTKQPPIAVAGLSKGMIDSKTFCSYMRLIIEAIAKLEPMVVCKCLVFVYSSNLVPTFNVLFQVMFENRYKLNGNND